MNRAILLMAGFLALSTQSVQAETKKPVLTTEALGVLEAIPVQHGGRIKPFKSYAQETLLYLSNRTTFHGISASALIFEWMANPQAGLSAAILPVGHPELHKTFGLRVIKNRISAENVLGDQAFIKLAEEAARKKDQEEALSVLDEKRVELYSRASYMRAVLSQSVPGMIPQSNNLEKGWIPLQELSGQSAMALIGIYPQPVIQSAALALDALFSGIRQASGGAGPVSYETAVVFRDALDELVKASQVPLNRKVIHDEMTYLNLRPFHWAWIFYLTGFIFMRFGRWKALSFIGLMIFTGAFLVQTYGIYLRVVIAGRPPVSNMYESLIWVSWVSALTALIAFIFYRSFMVLSSAGPVAALILLLAEKFPVVFSPAIDTLVPVLRSNLWLTVHVLTITMSYGAFALAWGMGHVLIFKGAKQPRNAESLAEPSKFLHRILMVGVALLAAGTILGGVWANYSWGRFWGWDPKETWALIALLGYLAVLHGRFAGWYGDFGIAAGAVISFLGVVMAWYGVNYVLAAGLHSYGFGGGGAGYVLLASLADLSFVLACIYKYQRSAAAKLTV